MKIQNAMAAQNSASNTQFHILSFEGPDDYARAGGISAQLESGLPATEMKKERTGITVRGANDCVTRATSAKSIDVFHVG
jgi:hypothetical protein